MREAVCGQAVRSFAYEEREREKEKTIVKLLGASSSNQEKFKSTQINSVTKLTWSLQCGGKKDEFAVWCSGQVWQTQTL
jgi:hypothetical protein